MPLFTSILEEVFPETDIWLRECSFVRIGGKDLIWDPKTGDLRLHLVVSDKYSLDAEEPTPPRAPLYRLLRLWGCLALA